MSTTYTGPSPNTLRELARLVEELEAMKSWRKLTTLPPADGNVPLWHRLGLRVEWNWASAAPGWRPLSDAVRAIVGERFEELCEEAIRRQQARVDELRAVVARGFGASERPASLYPIPTERIVVFGDASRDAAEADPVDVNVSSLCATDRHGADGACGGNCESCTTCTRAPS